MYKLIIIELLLAYSTLRGLLMAFWNISATSLVKFGGRALLGTLVFNLREGIEKKKRNGNGRRILS